MHSGIRTNASAGMVATLRRELAPGQPPHDRKDLRAWVRDSQPGLDASLASTLPLRMWRLTVAFSPVSANAC